MAHMCTLVSDIVSVILFAVVLDGIVMLLLVIHFLTTYFKPTSKQGGGSKQFSRDLDALRREEKKSQGVSQHNLFYTFFFREN